jgi:ATP-binding cassette subfamily F protein 3
MQYFAQDEATRLDPTLNIYQTLAGNAPLHMVPSIRNILGGFLFSGDDVEKPVRVLSGGERTRLAVARMLLRPSNTLLLDEPTNHLDLDSKDVLLDALEDFGGTLIFVSHDRYFVDKLATKVIHIGGGEALAYPGTYEEFLWSRKQREAAGQGSVPPGVGSKATKGPTSTAGGGARSPGADVGAPRPGSAGASRIGSGRTAPQSSAPRSSAAHSAGPGAVTPVADAPPSYEARKRQDADARRVKKAGDARLRRIADLEGRIAEREQAVRDLEATMAAPGFYENHEAAKPIVDRHQAILWEIGDLMHQWEELHETKL